MDAKTLRILDANANRAREGLRVLEDYARFTLDDKESAQKLKSLRHELTAVLGSFVAQAILHRNTPGDVGTDLKHPGELNRTDLASVVTAAGKRLGEALRVIEEYAKIEFPQVSAQIEKIRYGVYDIEHRLAFSLRPTSRFKAVRLYVLITQSICKRDWLETAEQAIAGGADCIQLREKELESGELLLRARRLVELCRSQRVISIINDRPDIAMLCDADGVHVGQGDLPVREVRKLVGTGKIVGVSTHNLEQAKQAVIDGADYIGAGPVFPSLTKPRNFLPGLDFAREVARKIDLPAVAIAGINLQNVDEVLKTGIRAVAVSSAICASEDVRAAAEQFKARLTSTPGVLPVTPP